MRRGEFEAAWRVSDRVLEKRQHYRHDKSLWHGEQLDRKRVLVRCCYGLGDTLQFIRYAALLRKITSGVTVQIQAAIARVLQCIDGIVTGDRTISTEAYDVAFRLTELPHVFRTNLQTIPAQIPYIHIPPRSLSPASSLGVGLVWE